MKRILAIAALVLASGSAQAGILYSFAEVGGNLVGTLSGRINLSGATFENATVSYGGAVLIPNFHSLSGLQAAPMGGNVVMANTYAATGPMFGGSALPALGTQTGDDIEIYSDSLILAQSYAGGALTGSVTFLNTSIADFNIVAGDYVYDVTGTGDTVTLRFAPLVTAGVPLPGVVPLLLIGLAAVGATRRRSPIA